MIEHTQEFELYHYGESLCCQMAQVALEEKQFEWKSHPIMLEEVAITGQNLTPEHLQVNPKGRVPTLVHHGTPVHDSYKIIRYLDQVRPQSGQRLVPDDKQLQAQIEEWVRGASLRDDVKFGTSLGMSIPVLSRPAIARCLKRQPYEHVMQKFEKHPVPVRAKVYMGLRATPLEEVDAIPDFVFDTVATALRGIERALGVNGDYILGTFTQVDVMMMAHFHRLEDVAFGDILNDEALPNTAVYWQRLQARPSYKSGVTDWHEEHWRQALAEAFGGRPSVFLNTLRQKVRASAT